VTFLSRGHPGGIVSHGYRNLAIDTGQEAAPFLEGPVASDAQSSAFVGGGHEPKQQLRPGVIQRGEPELVNDDGISPKDRLDDPPDRVVGKSPVQGGLRQSQARQGRGSSPLTTDRAPLKNLLSFEPSEQCKGLEKAKGRRCPVTKKTRKNFFLTHLVDRTKSIVKKGAKRFLQRYDFGRRLIQLLRTGNSSQIELEASVADQKRMIESMAAMIENTSKFGSDLEERILDISVAVSRLAERLQVCETVLDQCQESHKVAQDPKRNSQPA
jgi:hypothetical protein